MDNSTDVRFNSDKKIKFYIIEASVSFYAIISLTICVIFLSLFIVFILFKLKCEKKSDLNENVIYFKNNVNPRDKDEDLHEVKDEENFSTYSNDDLNLVQDKFGKNSNIQIENELIKNFKKKTKIGSFDLSNNLELNKNNPSLSNIPPKNELESEKNIPKKMIPCQEKKLDSHLSKNSLNCEQELCDKSQNKPKFHNDKNISFKYLVKQDSFDLNTELDEDASLDSVFLHDSETSYDFQAKNKLTEHDSKSLKKSQTLIRTNEIEKNISFSSLKHINIRKSMESLDIKNSSVSSGTNIARDNQHSEKISKLEEGEQINILKSYGCDTNRPFNTSDPLLASLSSRSDSFVKKKIEHFEKRSESLKESNNEVSSLKESSNSFVKRSLK